MDQPSNPKDPKAPSPSGDQGGEPPLHPLVKKVVHDPENIPDTVTVLGYLGASSKDGFYRIYLDSDFRTYFEVKKEHLFHAEKADPSDEDKPTRIFIHAAAELALVQIFEASFLKGGIASAYPVGDPIAPSCCPPTTCGGSNPTFGCAGPSGGSSGTFGCPPVGDTCAPTFGCAGPSGGSSGTFGPFPDCGGQSPTHKCTGQSGGSSGTFRAAPGSGMKGQGVWCTGQSGGSSGTWKR